MHHSSRSPARTLASIGTERRRRTVVSSTSSAPAKAERAGAARFGPAARAIAEAGKPHVAGGCVQLFPGTRDGHGAGLGLRRGLGARMVERCTRFFHRYV